MSSRRSARDTSTAALIAAIRLPSRADPRRKATRITQQLHALGYRVTLEPVAWSDGLVIFES